MIKKNIATNELGFVFNPATGDSYSTNPIAASIIRMLKDGRSVSDVKRSILDLYDIDRTTVEKDVDEFVHVLKDHTLWNS